MLRRENNSVRPSLNSRLFTKCFPTWKPNCTASVPFSMKLPVLWMCTKLERPRPSLVPSSERARTKEMCPSPLVMNRFTPLRYHVLSIVPFIMAAELVARADAGLQNIWGLQDCAETINEFASAEQKAKYLPRVSAGETCAMDLTEPDAGSDLQAVPRCFVIRHRHGRQVPQP